MVLVRLDLSSETPIYGQIAGSVRTQIQEGVLVAGDRLPAARGLAESLDVNVHTVLKAYSDLESEGLIEVRRGRGGVIVRSAGDLREAVGSLVLQAKRSGVTRRRFVELVEEAW